MAAFMSVPNPRSRHLILPELGRIQQLRRQVSGVRSQEDSRLRTLTPETLKSKTAGPTPCRLACIQNVWGPLLTFIDHFLEFVSGSEFGDSTSSDLDGGTRLRVSAIAGLALRDGKRAESNQGYPVPFSKGSGNAVHGGIDRGRCLRLGNVAGSGDPVNQISFIHALS